MKKAARHIIVLALVLACLLAYAPTSRAASLPNLPNSMFLTQNVAGTCTLCSAAMMLRSSLYQHGDNSWSTVTENGLRTIAWVEGVGLRWYFTYQVGNTTIQVGHKNLSGVSKILKYKSATSRIMP